MWSFMLDGVKYEVDKNSIIGLRCVSSNEYYDKVKPFLNETTGKLWFRSIMYKSCYYPDEYQVYMSPNDLVGWVSTIDILE
ncbi:MAG TPA: hypothetical protein GXZ90_09840 [Clostridiales bacterium]|nr:hypothetical protein [Clostridiales bacterium]